MGPYFAPEQLLEGRLPDAKTDVYSLGVVLYEGITGEQVRRGKTFEQQVKLVKSGNLVPPSHMNVAVGPALDEVLQRALAPERSKRYANAREFALALGEAASAFMWRPKLRAQFITKHFDERRRQDESLRAMLASLPKRATPAPVLTRVRTLAQAVIPSIGLPPPARQASRPSAPRVARKSGSRTLAPLVGLLGMAMGLTASTLDLSAVQAAPLPPPPIAVVRLAPIVLATLEEPLELQVERVWLESPRLNSSVPASIEPASVVHVAAQQPARKVKRTVRRARDEAPVPPWLVKRARR